LAAGLLAFFAAGLAGAAATGSSLAAGLEALFVAVLAGAFVAVLRVVLVAGLAAVLEAVLVAAFALAVVFAGAFAGVSVLATDSFGDCLGASLAAASSVFFARDRARVGDVGDEVFVVWVGVGVEVLSSAASAPAPVVDRVLLTVFVGLLAADLAWATRVLPSSAPEREGRRHFAPVQHEHGSARAQRDLAHDKSRVTGASQV
jgi:hypothetical protein